MGKKVHWLVSSYLGAIRLHCTHSYIIFGILLRRLNPKSRKTMHLLQPRDSSLLMPQISVKFQRKFQIPNGGTKYGWGRFLKNVKKLRSSIQVFQVFIFIVNLLNKLQIHIFIVVLEIHHLHLNFLHDNQCSSLLNASYSLEWIHQLHSLKSKQTALSMTFIADN